MKPITITVDQKWVDELIKRLDKYDMFKDRNQKIFEWAQTTADTEKSLKKGKVTQTMVEQWCRDNDVKLIQNKYIGPNNGNLSICPAVWIRPTIQDEVCTAHTQCHKCGICIDSSEGAWKSQKTQKIYCESCSRVVKMNRMTCTVPEIECYRPKHIYKKV